MVSITRPGTSGSQDNSQISLGVAGSAGAGLASIGAEVSSAGKRSQQTNQISLAQQLSSYIDQEGKRIFEESKQAHQSALLLDKTTEATETFIAAKNQRYSQQIDKDGNPTFQTLHSDIESIGNKILEGTANKIIDPEVSRAFKEKFSSYIANQKVSALKTAQRQQVQYGLSSLDQGIKKLTAQAVNDNIDQLRGYEQQGVESLQEALAGGLITPAEYNRRAEKFTQDIRVGAIRKTIQEDRAAAAQLLSMSAEDIGISEKMKERLTKTLSAAVKADQIEAKKAEEVRSIDELTQEAALIENIENRIDAGDIREDELLSYEGQISDKKYKKLTTKYIEQEAKREQERLEYKDFGMKIINGESIADKKPSEVNSFYNYMVKQRADISGNAVTLAEEAMLAASIPAPVSAFAEKLEYAVKFGDTQNAEQALAAYTYIKDRNKPSLESGFDNEATLIMEHAERLVEHAGLNPTEALVRSRDIISDINKPTRDIRSDLFKKETDFKDVNLEETAASELGAESLFGTNRITQDAVYTFREFAREGYIKSGDKKTAIAYAKQLMSKKYGNSEVTSDTQYMFNPPEKVFPNLSSKSLRDVLVTEVTPMLPEGIDPDSISIASDDLTSGQIQITGNKGGESVSRNVATWVVTYKVDIDGEKIEVPLINQKTGQPLRWSPLGTKVFEERQQANLEEARRAREEFLRGEE